MAKPGWQEMTQQGQIARVFSPMKADAGARKLLIVDDEPLVCEILSRWLDAEGFNCHSVTRAEEALRALEQADFALMLTDIKMPGTSGLDLLAQARRRWPELAVVVVTGVDDRQVALKALELGAFGYVIKPLERNEVVINVVNALERRRLQMESRRYQQRLEAKTREQTREIRLSREEVVLRLIAAQEYRHDETGAHVRRIGLYGEILARRLGYPEELAEMIRLAAPMHDVGKIGIPDAILRKPGRLTPAEREVMKKHTAIGARILGGSSIPMLRLASQIALCHHEKWDGTGYPRGLIGEHIPEAARIVAIIDVYDALTHERVYRPALPEEEALEILREGRDRHFDPRIFDTFMKSLDELRSVGERVKEDVLI